MSKNNQLIFLCTRSI